jgi:hypothetical protein
MVILIVSERAKAVSSVARNIFRCGSGHLTYINPENIQNKNNANFQQKTRGSPCWVSYTSSAESGWLEIIECFVSSPVGLAQLRSEPRFGRLMLPRRAETRHLHSFESGSSL